MRLERRELIEKYERGSRLDLHQFRFDLLRFHQLILSHAEVFVGVRIDLLRDECPKIRKAKHK
jgi:hypothetical protein